MEYYPNKNEVTYTVKNVLSSVEQASRFPGFLHCTEYGGAEGVA